MLGKHKLMGFNYSSTLSHCQGEKYAVLFFEDAVGYHYSVSVEKK